MHIVNIKESEHKFEKQNLVTKIATDGRGYDEVICSKCKVRGRRYNFTSVHISGVYKRNKARYCGGVFYPPKRIKILHCDAQGKQFKNLLPNSEHDVITPPDGYTNDSSGVWVMGVGEPVKVLTNEFQKLETSEE